MNENYTETGKNILNRSNEVNIIGYQIQNSDDIIIGESQGQIVNGRYTPKYYFVKTTDGIMQYTPQEMEEIYVIDFESSDLERLGWTA